MAVSDKGCKPVVRSITSLTTWLALARLVGSPSFTNWAVMTFTFLGAAVTRIMTC